LRVLGLGTHQNYKSQTLANNQGRVTPTRSKVGNKAISENSRALEKEKDDIAKAERGHKPIDVDPAIPLAAQ
jgi:hypothetical protein